MQQAQAEGGAPSPSSTSRGAHAYVAEFLGTFALVLFITVVLCVFAPRAIVQVGAQADPVVNLTFRDWSVVGLVHIFVLAGLAMAFGGLSGGHFNPAITLAKASKRLIGPADAGIYVLLQLLGAVLAALLVKYLIKDAGEAANFGAPAIAENIFLKGSLWKGSIVEFAGTFFLMTAYMAAYRGLASAWLGKGLIIGGTLGFLVMCFGPMEGGSFNPARAFGPLLIGDFGSFKDFILAYALAPILGAIAAIFAFDALSKTQKSA